MPTYKEQIRVRHSLRSWLSRHAVFPAHEWLKKHRSLKIYKELLRNQWLSCEQIEANQSKKLSLFLKSVAQDNAYYRTLGLGNNPSLQDFPMMDKARLSENLQVLKEAGAKGLVLKSTGGSTGTPFRFWVGKPRISHDIGAKLRATGWWGVDLGHKELVIWGSPIESSGQGRIKSIRDYLLGSRFYSITEFTPEQMDRILERMFKHTPQMLFAYPSILYALAQRALSRSMTFQGIHVAFVTSEVLEPYQRRLIEQVFSTRVANGYGAREGGFIAHECPSGGLHVSEDIVVEILDEQGRPLPYGKVGQLVITHLHTKEFPMIRYQTGDYAALSSRMCPCGRGLRVLEQLEGRVSDLIEKRDGSLVHRATLTDAIGRHEAIKQFRLEQYSYDEFRLFYAGQPIVDPAPLLKQLELMLGGTCTLHHQRKISPLSSGKHRCIINHMKQGTAHALQQA